MYVQYSLNVSVGLVAYNPNFLSSKKFKAFVLNTMKPEFQGFYYLIEIMKICYRILNSCVLPNVSYIPRSTFRTSRVPGDKNVWNSIQEREAGAAARACRAFWPRNSLGQWVVGLGWRGVLKRGSGLASRGKAMRVGVIRECDRNACTGG